MKKLAIGILSLVAATSAIADEGMWMPQQIPQLAAELRKAGLKIDPSRFADLTGDPMGAVVSAVPPSSPPTGWWSPTTIAASARCSSTPPRSAT